MRTFQVFKYSGNPLDVRYLTRTSDGAERWTLTRGDANHYTKNEAEAVASWLGRVFIGHTLGIVQSNREYKPGAGIVSQWSNPAGARGPSAIPSNPPRRARARAPAARGYRARFRNGRVLEYRSSSDAHAVAYARGLGAHKAGAAPVSVRRATIKKKVARGVGRAANNPAPRRNGEAAQAARALEEFTGRPATMSRARAPKIGRAGWVLGKVSSISYIATRDGEPAEYVHGFRSRSRPQLVSSADGSQLYLLGGAYSVTDRGIEDSRS